MAQPGWRETSADPDGFSGTPTEKREDLDSSIEAAPFACPSPNPSGAGGGRADNSRLMRVPRRAPARTPAPRSGDSTGRGSGGFSRASVALSGVSESRFQPDASQEHTSGFTRSQPRTLGDPAALRSQGRAGRERLGSRVPRFTPPAAQGALRSLAGRWRSVEGFARVPTVLRRWAEGLFGALRFNAGAIKGVQLNPEAIRRKSCGLFGALRCSDGTLTGSPNPGVCWR